MRRLTVFNHITLDGYFTGPNGDFSWARSGNDDAEYSAFVADNARGEAVMLFGRVTYQLMASYWPTPIAQQHDPIVAERMNLAQKVVFSKTLDDALWSNTSLIKGDMIEEIKKMKSEQGPDLVMFGSGSIIAQLAPAGLVDEYQMVLNPVAIGTGRTMFNGLPDILKLKPTNTRVFNNGKIFLCFNNVTF